MFITNQSRYSKNKYKNKNNKYTKNKLNKVNKLNKISKISKLNKISKAKFNKQHGGTAAIINKTSTSTSTSTSTRNNSKPITISINYNTDTDIVNNADLTSLYKATPNLLNIAPTITFENISNTQKYLIIMYDPYAPNGKISRNHNGNHIFIHWIFTQNGNVFNSRENILSYIPPTPPRGIHYYEFHIYIANETNIIIANTLIPQINSANTLIKKINIANKLKYTPFAYFINADANTIAK